jgi:hypothetical protein
VINGGFRVAAGCDSVTKAMVPIRVVAIGVQMRSSLRQELACVFTVCGITLVVWTNAAHGQSYYRWGVFRERGFLGNPIDQRRCRIQEIAPNEIVLDELLTKTPTQAEAVSAYRFLISRGQCAP